jgi:hypothetical protein
MHPSCVRETNQTKRECTRCLLCISRLLFFLFPLCASESTPTKPCESTPTKPCESTPTVRKHPNQVPKGPQPSPERAPTKSRKGPRPCESTPDSDLNQAKLCPIWPSVLLVFLNSQCRASFRPLPSQHAMPFWCQQNESTHHFLKSLTFRRPTLLFSRL